ncbi:PD-(D/E)XK motif protein [Nocardioides sp.]|uniref:PD-(D/E)XK motif protein n=1 Tax=Nocardioides sp. TaxID=35761 RepID=UPI00351188DE
MTEVSLAAIWREHLLSPDSGLHLADPSHPLQIFVGKTDQAAPRMVIRSVARPARPALSEIVLVERYQDGSGKWNLRFTLQNRAFNEVFLRLADHVHASSAKAPSEEAALDRVLVVLDEWRRLIRPRPAGLLSMEALRGLVGELWLVLEHFTASKSMDAVVHGWLGPLGLPQDFWFEGEGHYEAKAVGPAMDRVKISSESQLDVDDLELIVLLVANTSETTVGAFNLPILVARVRERLLTEGVVSDALDERLTRLGVQLNDHFYSDTWFVLEGMERYKVTDGFPRIVGSDLTAGIGRVRYEISIPDLEPFRIAHLGDMS